jgi:hypothetical protein
LRVGRDLPHRQGTLAIDSHLAGRPQKPVVGSAPTRWTPAIDHARPNRRGMLAIRSRGGPMTPMAGLVRTPRRGTPASQSLMARPLDKGAINLCIISPRRMPVP